MDAWRVKESRTIVDRAWLRIDEQQIELPHGGTIEDFHLIAGPDWVAVLALSESGKIVLVDQYRHGAGRVSRELPAGVIDASETPLDAARRELLEETGWAADDWRPLLSVQTEPARHTTRAHFFFAAGARQVAEQRVEACENIAVALVTPDELFDQIERGVIFHGVHIGAIYTAARRGYV